MSDHEKHPRIKDTIHCFGPKSFQLKSLPIPRAGQILGLVGNNGIGKSILLKLLCGSLKPNLGRFNDPPDWQEILAYFKGSELHDYFIRFLVENLKGSCKPQHVCNIPRVVQGNVGKLICVAEDNARDMIQELDLTELMDRNMEDLSCGELQRVAIAFAALKKVDIFCFDELSTFLDVKQRLKAAQIVRSLVRPDKYVIVVENDLSVLEYLSDSICCIHGRPGVHGLVTLPFSVTEGINIFLAGFVPTQNLMIRYKPLKSFVAARQSVAYKYPTMTLTRGNFRLKVEEGEFTDSQILVMLGQNGTGKTTFLHMLAGLLKPDSDMLEIPKFNCSYKPQRIDSIKPEYEISVKMLLRANIPDAFRNPHFLCNVFEPLSIQKFVNKDVGYLSTGELQKLSLTLCLGKPADVYLIDEPSTYLDSETRIVASNVIKNFIRHVRKTAIVVEHDFTMATYLADRVIVYEGKPSIDCVANSPQSLLTGMNLFLSHLDITLRRDPTSSLHRYNKHGSTEDREQKATGSYYYMGD